MVSTSDFKKGLKLLIDEEPYTIVDFQHVKPGKGNQFTRTKLKNLVTGSNLDRTIKSGEKFPEPDIEYKDMSYLYVDDNGFNFMDQTNFEQMSLSSELIGGDKDFLLENMEVKICLFNERAVGIELPKAINVKITQTDPGFKGNTVTNTTKPATVETGAQVQVPLHINEGDLVRVDTRTRTYVERVNLK